MKEYADKIQMRRKKAGNEESRFLNVDEGPVMAPPRFLFSPDGEEGSEAGEGELAGNTFSLAGSESVSDDRGSAEIDRPQAELSSRMPIAEPASLAGFEAADGESESLEEEGMEKEGADELAFDGGDGGDGGGKKKGKGSDQREKSGQEGFMRHEGDQKTTTRKKEQSELVFQSPPPLEKYKIKKGDTFWALDIKFGLPHGTLQGLNPGRNPRKLRIGSEIWVRRGGMVLKERHNSNKKPKEKYVKKGNREMSATKLELQSVPRFEAVTSSPFTGWRRMDGTILNKEDLKKVKIYILHDDEFDEQAMVQYEVAVKKYGAKAVGVSNTGSASGFANAWENMNGEIKEVMIMMHGKNQSIRPGETDQLTATGNDSTNISGAKALNIQDLPKPLGNIDKANLMLYTCHSADPKKKAHGSGDHAQGDLKGTKETVAEAFFNHFNFRMVRGTAGSVNYHSFRDRTFPLSNNYMRPYPVDGYWIDFIREKEKAKIKSTKAIPPLPSASTPFTSVNEQSRSLKRGHGMNVDLNEKNDPRESGYAIPTPLVSMALGLGKTIRELDFARRNPSIALAIGPSMHGLTNISANTARLSTNDLGLTESYSHEGSEVNAFRHALWQAAITNSFGSHIAKEVGFAHEENPFAISGENRKKMTFSTEHEADGSCDLRNNEIGRLIGTSKDPQKMNKLALKVLDYYHEKGLWVVVLKKDKTFTIQRQQIDDKRFEKAKKRLLLLNEFGYDPHQQAEVTREFETNKKNMKMADTFGPKY